MTTSYEFPMGGAPSDKPPQQPQQAPEPAPAVPEAQSPAAAPAISPEVIQQLMTQQQQAFDAQIKAQQQTFESQVAGITQKQREATVSELQASLAKAAEEGDMEAYHAQNMKLHAAQQAPAAPPPKAPEIQVPEAPAKSLEVLQWETQNPWINDLNDPRTAMAEGAYQLYWRQNPQGNAADALKHVNAAVNPPADAAASNYNRTAKGASTTAAAAGNVNLSYEEKQLFEALKSAGVYKTVDEYKQSIAKEAQS